MDFRDKPTNQSAPYIWRGHETRRLRVLWATTGRLPLSEILLLLFMFVFDATTTPV